MSRARAGFTAVELLVVMVVVGIAAAITLPALLRSARNQELVRCENNLLALHKAEAEARAEGRLPANATGGAYWAAVAPGHEEWLTCPLSRHARYRGPAGNPTRLPMTYPIGGDAPGAHGPGEGGYLLIKSGDIRACRERDEIWIESAKLLAP
jgi:prepilin-type N-terminal cleavage/methylation domain-containing protein